MKAIQLANAEGQKIYTITQDNINDVLPKIQASTLTLNAISNAVNAGKTVTVHEREVSVPGWTGTGYMVIDPVTGDGAYMISGGGNGGWALIGLLSTTLLLSVGIRNALIKYLSGLKAVPILGSMANFLILSSLIIKAIDIALNCKAASPMIAGMMLMSAIILGLGMIISFVFNPIIAYAFSAGTIALLKSSIDTANCRKP
jgi:hypothetical protein